MPVAPDSSLYHGLISHVDGQVFWLGLRGFGFGLGAWFWLDDGPEIQPRSEIRRAVFEYSIQHKAYSTA